MSDGHEGLNARDIFLQDSADLGDALGKVFDDAELNESGGPLAGGLAASDMLRAQIGSAIENILDALALDQIIMGGWKQISELNAALDQTERNGGSQYVSLADHKITSTHQPSVELTVNGSRVKLFDIDLAFNFQMKGCELEIENGSISNIGIGSAAASGELKVANRTILERESGRLDVDRLFRHSY